MVEEKHNSANTIHEDSRQKFFMAQGLEELATATAHDELRPTQSKARMALGGLWNAFVGTYVKPGKAPARKAYIQKLVGNPNAPAFVSEMVRTLPENSKLMLRVAPRA
jgi:hypothetical protein